LGENHEKVLGFPGFPARRTSREQLCAAFFTESRMQFDGTTKPHRKSGFGLHQLRNRCSETKRHAAMSAQQGFVNVEEIAVAAVPAESFTDGYESIFTLK
jgi:hypothetical protein